MGIVTRLHAEDLVLFNPKKVYKGHPQGTASHKMCPVSHKHYLFVHLSMFLKLNKEPLLEIKNH